MALLKAMIKSADRVKEFETYFNDLPVEHHTAHSLELQKTEITRLWEHFKSCYENVLTDYEEAEEAATSKTERTDLGPIKRSYFSTYESQLRMIVKINEILDTFRKKPKSQERNESSQDQTQFISLPPCDTEIFHGDYKSWPTFRDMFTALYGNNKRLSPVEKMCHLLKKTQGEARELLKTCPITNDGFEMAWHNLVSRYENKRVLVNAQLKSLFNISPISKETGPNIRRLQRTINDCVTNLTLLRIDTSNWDIIFVYICSTCLPDITLNLWEHSLPHTTELPSWKAMDAFLTSRFQTLESVADIRSTFSSSQPFKPSQSLNTHKSNSANGKRVHSYKTSVCQQKAENSQTRNHKMGTQKMGLCDLCAQSHPLRLCPNFLSLSIDDRYAVVKKTNRCINCLANSHHSKACTSKYVCTVCKKKHHSLLHRGEPVVPALNSSSHQPPNVINNQPPAALDLTPSTSAEASNRTLRSFSTQLQATAVHPPSQSVVLGTALVDVYNNDIKCTVRALIDSASEATFISQKLQRTLSLPTRTTQAKIHGLNDSLTATSTLSCQIRVRSPVDKSFELLSDALVVKKLTGQLTHYPSSTLKNCNFSHLKLADTHRNGCSEVDLLLGGDAYPKIIQEGLQWDTQQSLVAQKTVFGWIITGRVTHNPCRNSVLSFFNAVELDQQLQRFWELEDLPKKAKSSPEDAYCENLYESTTFRNNNGRYVVSSLLNKNSPKN